MASTAKVIRPAKASDNDALLALSRECPLEGSVTLYVDRGPEYFRMFEILDDDPRVLVWDDDGKIRGAITAVHRTLHLSGQSYRSIIVRDLKVAPEHRNGLVGHRLVRAIIEQEETAGTKLAILSHMNDNEATVPFTQGRARIPSGHHLGAFLVHNVIPILRAKELNTYKVSPMQASDVEEVVTLINDHLESYSLAPRYEVAAFEALVDSLPGVCYDDILLARRNGSVEALVGLWDSADVANCKVLDCRDRGLRIAWQIQNMLRRIRGQATIPFFGTNLRFKHLFISAIASGGLEALACLLHRVNNEIRDSDYSHFSVCFHERDPLNDALKKLVKVSMPHSMIAFHSQRPDTPPVDYSQLDADVPYADFLLYI